MWKGDDVSYGCLHRWVKRHLEKPKTCKDCGLEKKLDLANISQDYRRDLGDWEWLCRRCHMIKDGRLKRLKKYQFSPLNRKCSLCDKKHYAKDLCKRHYYLKRYAEVYKWQ